MKQVADERYDPGRCCQGRSHLPGWQRWTTLQGLLLNYGLDMSGSGRVGELMYGAVRAPEELLAGASPEQLARLEERLGRPLPKELAALLTICNGGAIGPGGIYGERPDETFLDLPCILAMFPEWAGAGWLPVAGDGCGNYWVLLDDGRVGFVDTTSDPGALDRVTDPDLFSLVERILEGDQAAEE